MGEGLRTCEVPWSLGIKLVISLGGREPFPLSSLIGLRISMFSCCLQIHKASATIIEPAGESDNPLRFTSGLVVALDVDATLEHVQDPQNSVKVQVCGVLH